MNNNTKAEKQNKDKPLSSIGVKSFLSVVIILSAILLLCGILTLIIPQGHFERDDNGGIIAGTFVQGKVKGIAIWRILTAPFRVFFMDGGITIITICIFLLVMSGVFNLLDKTGGLKAIITKMLMKLGKRKKTILCLGVLFFMMFGSLFGLFEELVTLLPFVTMFMLSLGFDVFTGLGVCMMSACFGFAAAITNPFSVGIASNLANVNVLDGVWLRIIFFAIIYGVMCLFLILHTNKITRKQTINSEQIAVSDVLDGADENNKKLGKVFGIFFIAQLVILVGIALIRPISGYAVPILSLTFLAGGIIAGLLVEKDKKKIFFYILQGVMAMLPAVLLIALASSVNLVMQESGIIDTIMNYVINLLSGNSVFVCALFIYLLVLILQIFIGSASAKIFLLMPILLPVSGAVGISPNLLILVYCMADGFSDMIIPTNPVLLIGLSMSKVSYGEWVRWTWKPQLIVLSISILTVLFATAIGF